MASARKMVPYGINLPPKNSNANGLTANQQKEWDMVHDANGKTPIDFIDLPYNDPLNGIKKVIPVAIYTTTRDALPPVLPDLLPPLNPPAYAIRDIPGKGKGVLATRNIHFGEVVIVERPLFILAPFIDLVTECRLFERYVRGRIDPKDWATYNNLTNVKDSRVPQFIGIASTNGFEIILKHDREHYAGVFPLLSRINHSCGPNVHHMWNSHLFTRSIQAVRPILAGEELTLPYEDLCEPHADRRFNLERKYNFKCTCGYCTNPRQELSNSIRRMSSELLLKPMFMAEYAQLVQSPSSRQHVLRILNNMISGLVTVTREGIEATGSLWYYVYMMKYSGLLADKKRFKDWGFKALLLSLRNMEQKGEPACREVEEWIDWIKEPEKTFPGWGRYR